MAPALIHRLLSHVHLAGSCSATAHARFLATIPPIALIAAPLLVQSAHSLTSQVDPSVAGPAAVCADPAAPVLLGSFVVVAAVMWRARGSACQGLGAI
jgi:hypothetical protein